MSKKPASPGVRESFARAKSAIDALLAERKCLSVEVEEITRMLHELGWRKPASSRRKGQIASVEGTKLSRVLEEIESEPGSTVGEICAETGYSSNHVSAACSTLISGEKIRRTGNRGNYSYFPVTDDGEDDESVPKALLR